MEQSKQPFQLMHGDCVEMMRNVPDHSVDLIITDPPYNLGNFMRDRQTNLKKMRSNFFGAAGWDDLEYEDWVDNMDQLLAESNRVLKKKGAMIMFMSLMKIESIVKLASRHRLYYKTTGVWHKRNPMPRNMHLHFINSVEGWLYFINDGKTGTFNNNNKALHDFIETSVSPSGEKLFGKHPTQKPESLFQHFVEVLTKPGETVLDPFMGSGTAGVVCKKTGRQFIGIELDETYFRFAMERIHAVRDVQSSLIEQRILGL